MRPYYQLSHSWNHKYILNFVPVQQAPSAGETCSPGIVISVLGLRINHCDSTAIAFDSCLHFVVPIALDSRRSIYQIPEGWMGTDFGGTESVARHAITNLSLLSKSSSIGRKKTRWLFPTIMQNKEGAKVPLRGAGGKGAETNMPIPQGASPIQPIACKL